MASLYIRDLDAHLVLALRRKALDEGKTLKQLVTPMLELLVNSKPVDYSRVDWQRMYEDDLRARKAIADEEPK